MERGSSSCRGSRVKLQRLTTKDCKRPQTNMLKKTTVNVWIRKSKGNRLRFELARGFEVSGVKPTGVPSTIFPEGRGRGLYTGYVACSLGLIILRGSCVLIMSHVVRASVWNALTEKAWKDARLVKDWCMVRNIESWIVFVVRKHIGIFLALHEPGCFIKNRAHNGHYH